jgi:isopenicillin N synthase-like dioxygenase
MSWRARLPMALLDVGAWRAAVPGSFARSSACAAFSASLQRFGFAGLVNHGVPASLTRDLHRGWSSFFDLPLAQRFEATLSSGKPYAPGFVPLGGEALEDLEDGNTVVRGLANEQEEEKKKKQQQQKKGGKGADSIEAFNFWLSHDPTLRFSESFPYSPRLPEDAPPFMRSLDANTELYASGMDGLVATLNEVTDTALGLAPGTMRGVHGDSARESDLALLKVANYLPQHWSGVAPHAARYSAHTDTTTFTILRTDGSPGLEVFLPRAIESDPAAAAHAVAAAAATASALPSPPTGSGDDGEASEAGGEWVPICPTVDEDLLIFNAGDLDAPDQHPVALLVPPCRPRSGPEALSRLLPPPQNGHDNLAHDQLICRCERHGGKGGLRSVHCAGVLAGGDGQNEPIQGFAVMRG